MLELSARRSSGSSELLCQSKAWGWIALTAKENGERGRETENDQTARSGILG